MADGVDGHGNAAGSSNVESLLIRVARARDDARRLNLPLSAHLLDMVCLDLSNANDRPEDRVS
ncbi:MAG: hypothetical protein AB7O56_06640 [Bauldia sp.]